MDQDFSSSWSQNLNTNITIEGSSSIPQSIDILKTGDFSKPLEDVKDSEEKLKGIGEIF